MKKIAVFASGSGSNYQAIVNYIQSDRDRKQCAEELDVALLVCDNPQALVLEKAAGLGTPSLVVDRKIYPSKARFEQAILARLEEIEIDFIVLAGYMRILGATLLNRYKGRTINIHPSLLPAFPGKYAIEQALAYGVRVTGISIHYVDEGMDTGPIIYQQPIEIARNETAESLATKIHRLEHHIYPRVVYACVQEQITLEDHEVRWNKELIL